MCPADVAYETLGEVLAWLDTSLYAPLSTDTLIVVPVAEFSALLPAATFTEQDESLTLATDTDDGAAGVVRTSPAETCDELPAGLFDQTL